jgi:nitrogenase molybdenum-iron protein alpha/beta subunit
MTSSPDYTMRTSPNYMAGALMAANAVSDALLVYRGSACVEEQVVQTFAPHDLGHGMSVNRAEGRLVLTMDPETVSLMGAAQSALKAARWGLQTRQVRVVLLSELIRHSLTGENIRRLSEQLEAELGVPCVATDADVLDRDFGDSTRSIMDGLARAAVERAPEAPLAEGSVAAVGYLRSRNEGDSDGDNAELRRILAGGGLELCSTWLSGGTWEELLEATRAQTIVGLPFAGNAARLLAERSRAASIATALPVSLAGTVAWLEAVAGAADRPGAFDSFVEQELRRVVSLLDRYATRFLRGKRVLVAATGDWLDGIVRCLSEDVGMEVVAGILRQRHPEDGLTGPEDLDALDRLVDPSVASLRHHADKALQEGGLDLVIGSFWERSALLGEYAHIPFLEFGYPQYRSHFLSPTPHLGFEGVLTWAQRIFEALELRTV